MVLLRAYRFLFRPRVRGVRCVLVHDDEVLLVRHAYGSRRWGLPGGLIKRSEDAQTTVAREMSEELGLSELQWLDLGRIEYTGADRGWHVVRCFACRVPSRSVTPDAAEIGDVAWFGWDELPADTLEGTTAIVALAREPGVS
jgi:ADP-ribose pyrophosphatase YjhB (NUDIX family)